jgi:hypothetical protein
VNEENEAERGQMMPTLASPKQSWIESKTSYNIFWLSSWVIVLLGIDFVFILTPWFDMIQGGSAWPFLRMLGGSIGVASVIAGPVILLGMAIFCVIKDRSPRHIKILWFIVFIATSCFGSALYFFTVYSKQIASKRLESRDQP